MPKIPDFSKFDLQSIVNSVKSIITPESTPNVAEGDAIGGKIVQISTLLQSAADHQAKAAKELTHINNLLNELYKDLEAFRKLEAELKQQQSSVQAGSTTTSGKTESTVSPHSAHTTGGTGTQSTSQPKPNIHTKPASDTISPTDTSGHKESDTTLHPGGKTKPTDSE
ncbi:MAG: hypothetical protein H0U71_08925 [Gammaproteobacteria bacterium]|nr:hypothetical protein [Gammaproteobacteria bacterium]